MASVKIEVDCNAKKIKIIWSAVVGKDKFNAADVATMKAAAEKFWNNRQPPDVPFKYYYCDIELEANLVLGKVTTVGMTVDKNGNPIPKTIPPTSDEPGHKSDDVIQPSPNTTPPGQGDTVSHGHHHIIYIQKPFTDLGHEIGHALDPDHVNDRPPNNTHWDQLGEDAIKAILKQMIWSHRGWDRQADCCGSVYHMDHEVSVTVTTAPGTDGKRKVTVTATSLAHKISRIQSWDATGQSVSDQKSVTSAPNNTVVDPVTGVAMPQAQKATADPVEFALADFPICVDVYEEGDDKEPADGHRHGWFDKDGKPVSVKGGALEPGRITNKTKGYYPAFGGTVTKGNSFKPPPAYQKP